MTTTVETAGKAEKLQKEIVREADGTTIVNVSLMDAKNRFAPTACNEVTITLPADGSVRLLGAGNGDPAFRIAERPAAGSTPERFTIPAFNGKAQFILSGAPDDVEVTL